MFFALLKRKQAWEQQEFLRAGIVAAAVINALGASKQPVNPRDFVPTFGKEKKKEETNLDLSSMSPEEQKAHIVDQIPAYLQNGKMFFNKKVLLEAQSGAGKRSLER